MLNVTPITVILFAQAVLVGLSQLDFVSPDAQQIIAIVLIVVNSAAAIFTLTPSGKAVVQRYLVKK